MKGAGLNKVRLIDVDELWLQEQEVRGSVPLSKTDGTRIPADLMTAHPESTNTSVHLDATKLVFGGGRVESAAQSYTMMATDKCETNSQRQKQLHGLDSVTS